MRMADLPEGIDWSIGSSMRSLAISAVKGSTWVRKCVIPEARANQRAYHAASKEVIGAGGRLIAKLAHGTATIAAINGSGISHSGTVGHLARWLLNRSGGVGDALRPSFFGVPVGADGTRAISHRAMLRGATANAVTAALMAEGYRFGTFVGSAIVGVANCA